MKTKISRIEKQRRVMEQLRDPLTMNNSDAVIARFCRVTPSFVKQVRIRANADGTAFHKGTYHEIEIAKLRLDGGTQPRAKLDLVVSREYRDEVKAGAAFPPIGVVYDGSDYWVWDGFHRIKAHDMAGRETIQCEVRQGTRRDAVLLAAGANSGHGLRRTNEDKRRAVEHLLSDPEWVNWTDNEIARRCGVATSFVGDRRREFAPSTLGGLKSTAAGREINTTNIGRKPSANGKATSSSSERSTEENGDSIEDPSSTSSESIPEPPMRQPVVVDHRISITLNGDPDEDYQKLIALYPPGPLARLGQLISGEPGDKGNSEGIIERLRQGPATPKELLRFGQRYGARIHEFKKQGYKIAWRDGAYWLEDEPASA